MAGGLFSGSSDGGTSETSPGGLFDDGTGTNVTATRTANQAADQSEQYADDAKGWAIGDAPDVDLDGWSDTNNSKYFSEQSEEYAGEAAQDANEAADSATAAASSASAAAASANLAQTYVDEAEGYAEDAAESATEAAESADEAANSANAANSNATQAAQAAASAIAARVAAETAETNAETAEANAEQSETNAAQSATDAANAETAAENSATQAGVSEGNAVAAALESEGYAVGEQNGVAVTSGTYFQNNAKYFAEQAASDALDGYPDIPDNENAAVRYELNVPAGSGNATWVEVDAGSELSGGNGITVSNSQISVDNDDTLTFISGELSVANPFTDADEAKLDSLPSIPANQTEAVKYELNIPANSGNATWTEIETTHLDYFDVDDQGLASTAADATGIGAIAIGRAAEADQQYDIAIGEAAQADGGNSVAIGRLAETSAGASIAIGYNAQAEGTNSTAVGENSRAEMTDSMALGENARAYTRQSTAIGQNAIANNDGDTEFDNLDTGPGGALAVGNNAQALYTNSGAIGSGSNARAADVITIGRDDNGGTRNAHLVELARQPADVDNDLTVATTLYVRDHVAGHSGVNLPEAPANETEVKLYELQVPANSGDATWVEANEASIAAGNGIDISDDTVSLDLLADDTTDDIYNGAEIKGDDNELTVEYRTQEDSNKTYIHSIFGRTVRGFDNDHGIEIATYVYNNVNFSYTPSQVIEWDRPITGLSWTIANNSDFQEEYITSGITTVDGTQVGTFTETEYQATTGDTLDADALTEVAKDPRTGQYNGAAGGTRNVSVALLTNEGKASTQTTTYSWGPAGFIDDSEVVNFSTQLFDAVRTSYQVTARVHPYFSIGNLSGSSASVDNGGGSASFSISSQTFTANITGATIYHDTQVSGNFESDFVRPTTVSDESESNRTYSDSQGWNITPSTRYKVWAILATDQGAFAASDLGSLSNSGYSLAATHSNLSSTTAWKSNNYSFDNSSGTSAVSGYLVAPSSGSTFQDTDLGFGEVAHTSTSVSLGHSSHTVTYTVYTFTVAAGKNLQLEVLT